MNTADELRKMGFDVKIWPMYREFSPYAETGTIDVWNQITDSNGITFYMKESATLDECLARYREKQTDFNAVNE